MAWLKEAARDDRTVFIRASVVEAVEDQVPHEIPSKEEGGESTFVPQVVIYVGKVGHEIFGTPQDIIRRVNGLLDGTQECESKEKPKPAAQQDQAQQGPPPGWAPNYGG